VRYALGANLYGEYAFPVPSTALTTPDGSGTECRVEYFDNPDLQENRSFAGPRRAGYFDMEMEDRRRACGGRPREVLGALDRAC